MKRWLAVVALSLVALRCGIHCAGAAETRQLKAGEVTITYPSGLEAQAQELVQAAAKVFPSRRSRLLRLRQAFADTDRIAMRVTDLLGCPEYVDAVRHDLSQPLFLATDDLFIGALTSIRLYRQSELEVCGGIREGPWELSLDPQTRTVSQNLHLGEGEASPSPEFLFMPFVLMNDGTLWPAEPRVDSLTEYSDELLRIATVFGFLPIHEAAEGALVEKARFYHPYARWFNDGVANWVALQVASEVAPYLTRQYREIALPEEGDDSSRAAVNLIAWAQLAYWTENPSAEEDHLGKVHYRYATQLIDRLLRDQPPGTLAAIVRGLKGRRNPDTAAICREIDAVTGQDSRSLLLEYVPDYVRAGLREGAPRRLFREAREKAEAGEYAEAVRLLSRLLEMTPSNLDARLNLAWALRQSRAPKDESERQVKTIVGLMQSRGEYAFRPFQTDDVETYYLLGRIDQLRGRKARARAAFGRVLQLQPDHADAKAALEELGGVILSFRAPRLRSG